MVRRKGELEGPSPTPNTNKQQQPTQHTTTHHKNGLAKIGLAKIGLHRLQSTPDPVHTAGSRPIWANRIVANLILNMFCCVLFCCVFCCVLFCCVLFCCVLGVVVYCHSGPSRRLRGPRGFTHTTTRELQTCTFRRPGASNTTKISRKKPPNGYMQLRPVLLRPNATWASATHIFLHNDKHNYNYHHKK